jgi:Transposase DDE domain group 1
MATFGVGRLEDLAKNDRLIAEIKDELAAADKTSRRTGKLARRFKQFKWTTRTSWRREGGSWPERSGRKAKANPRFIVTSLTGTECKARYLYEIVYCARGDMENRIKECQLDLYADRTSTTIRLKLPRIGVLVIISVCRIRDRFGGAGCAVCGPGDLHVSRYVLAGGLMSARA